MRWLIRSFLALCLLVAVAVAALFLIPTERIARSAAEKFEAITGRVLSIEGSVRPTVWPVLGVRTGRFAISNAEWSGAGPMLRADALEIGLDMAALWRGDVRITGVRVIRPEVMLERAADGRENWVFGGSETGSGGGTGEARGPGEGRTFSLDLAEVSDGAFTFIDHGSGQRIELESLSGTARIPAFTGPAEIGFSAVMNGQPLRADLRLVAFASFLEGKVTGLEARLRVGEATLALDGRGGLEPMAFSGQLTAGLGDLGSLARLSGIARPTLPEGLGARSITLSGEVTLAADTSLHLRGGDITLDGNRLRVDADLTRGGDRPRLVARIGAGALNLAGLAGGAGGGASGGARAEGWPTDRIDVSGLGALDADLSLSAEAIDLGAVRFGPSRLSATLDRGRAVFDLREVSAYGGAIRGQFVVNGRGGLSVRGDLELAGLSLQPLLMDAGGYDRLIGTGDLELEFLGVGNSVDAIMRSLSGQGRLALSKGELRGLDIAGMLRNLDASYVGEGQKTIFDGITAGFALRDGVLANDDLLLKAPYLTATGSGNVGIGARTLDYRLRPTALAAADGSGGIMVPMSISGTWADPKFRLDLESLARERLEAEAKALEEQAKARAKEAEAQARAELERKAQKELGIQRQEGESLEDAARRRAEEALEAEAGRLLNRLLGAAP